MLREYKAMVDGSPIITVLAHNSKEARKIVGYELTKNPSRLPYFKKWEATGQGLLDVAKNKEWLANA